MKNKDAKVGDTSIKTRALLLRLGAGLLRRLGHLAGLAVRLLDRLDDADGDRLAHVTNGEAAERGVLVVGLDAHGLRGDELDDGGVARLDELGRGLHDLTGTAVDLLDERVELARNVGRVAVEDGRVAGADLSGVVEDNDLGVERSSLLGGVVLRVGADVSTADVLDRDVLDVEANVVSGETLGELLVVLEDEE
jgi:hypothetical protein